MNNGQFVKDQIRGRAYEIFCQRGGEGGHDTDDWLQAEYELMHLPIHKIAELGPTKTAPNIHYQARLVGLVQAALLLGGGALSQLRR